jgi:endonuclease IV
MKLGPHASKADTPNAQREEARQQGWGVIQTHAGNPRTLHLDPMKIEESDGRKDVTWVVHSCYPAFFCPSKKNEAINSQYLLNLARWCQRAGAEYIVLHMGATKDRNPADVVNEGRNYWAAQTALIDFLWENHIKVLIENVAAAYPTNQDLIHIQEMLRGNRDVLGWCLDFAHSNGAGVKYDQVLEYIESPEKRPNIIHCNYPDSEFNSGRDRHGWLYKDQTPVDDDVKELWKDNVRAAVKAEIPLIVEGNSKATPLCRPKEIEAIKGLFNVSAPASVQD